MVRVRAFVSGDINPDLFTHIHTLAAARMKMLIVALALLYAPQAQSDTWLNLGGLSYHPGGAGFNNLNIGVGLELDTQRVTVGIGAYLNSVRRVSKYIVAETMLIERKGFGVGVIVGVVDGYPMNNGGGFIPLVAPTLHIPTGNESVAVRVVFIPPVSDKVNAVISAQLRILLSR